MSDGGIGDAPDAALGVDSLPPGACIGDADCNDGICHELSGACVPDAEALFVAPSGAGTACTRASPCGTLQTAVDQRTNARFTIALAAGTYSSSWDLSTLQANVENLIISGPTRSWDDAVIMCSAMNRVNDQITAVFEGVTIRGSTAATDGIDNRGNTKMSRVWIDLAGDFGAVSRGGSLTIVDSLVTKSANSGIYATGGTLTVERTQVLSNAAYGIDVDGAAFTIKNTIIASNGESLRQSGGARLRPANNGPAVFRFNTLARNRGLTYLSLTCDTNVAISNVIIGEETVLTSTMSPMCSATYSLFNGGFVPPGTGNLSGDPMFVSTTDFHLQMGSPAIDNANPMGAEPIDIDGQPRAASPDIGADERI